ncbi:hypothetical protein AGLY_018058 [Aphis glycines]|uniref:Uncharacterized protein n=1 Tax=Aphis glycines TaxID=307491 RepID=A0A6G0STD7_APHGL|nr:hypothetical protein AGLY_018058 [Aphis glycines]
MLRTVYNHIHLVSFWDLDHLSNVLLRSRSLYECIKFDSNDRYILLIKKFFMNHIYKIICKIHDFDEFLSVFEFQMLIKQIVPIVKFLSYYHIKKSIWSKTGFCIIMYIIIRYTLYVSTIIYVPVESLETLKNIELLRRQKSNNLTPDNYTFTIKRCKYKSNYTLVVNRNFKLLLIECQTSDMVLPQNLCTQQPYAVMPAKNIYQFKFATRDVYKCLYFLYLVSLSKELHYTLFPQHELILILILKKYGNHNNATIYFTH